VRRAPLFFKQSLQLTELVLFETDLGLEVVLVSLQLLDALVERDLLVFKTADFTLKLCLVRLLVVGDSLESQELLEDLVSF